MKRDLIVKYAKTQEDFILLANILDKNNICRDKGYISATGFLDLRTQGIISKMKIEFTEKYLLFGGYEDAERKMLMFFPDYMEINPYELMCILRVNYSANNKLSHRDLLGSLMSLGITRENVGDILVSEGLAQVIVKREMADFLEMNLSKAAKANLECDIAPLSELFIPEVEAKEITDTLASLRLDAACASAFSMSRGNAARLIEAKKVYINDLPCEKCDKQLSEGDKIRIKGFGRAFLSETGGTSRKGRTFVKFKVYR